MVAIGKSGLQAILSIRPSSSRAEMIAATAPRRQLAAQTNSGTADAGVSRRT
jgi:hypothetical protein